MDNPTHNIANETIWITGAGSGLGQALTKALAINGNTLIISGRDITKLQQLESDIKKENSNVTIHLLPMDISDKDKTSNYKAELSEITNHLDRIILNAGTCEYITPTQIDWSLMANISNTNFLGTINCLEVGFNLLKKSTAPHIVGISSLVVQAPFTRAEAYGASKAALDYCLQSLRLDIKQFNIDISIIRPGFIDTPLTRKNDFPMPFLMTAENAAKRVVIAIETRKLCYAFPKRLSWLLKLSSLMPKTWINLNYDKSSINTHNKNHAGNA